MIAAIYARKCTEQTGVADEQKSVARQIEHARRTPSARAGPWTRPPSTSMTGSPGAEFAQPAGIPAADERAEAAAAVPGARHVRGIPART